jgi:hypothetical protein
MFSRSHAENGKLFSEKDPRQIRSAPAMEMATVMVQTG